MVNNAENTAISITITAGYDDNVANNDHTNTEDLRRLHDNIAHDIRQLLEENYTTAHGEAFGGYDGIHLDPATINITVHPQTTNAALSDEDTEHLLRLVNERLDVAELNMQQLSTMTSPPPHTMHIVKKELARWGKAREALLYTQGEDIVISDNDIASFFNDNDNL